MPKFGLSPEEMKTLSYFLKSRVREPYYETPMMRLFKEREEKRLEKENLLKPVSAEKELLKGKKSRAFQVVKWSISKKIKFIEVYSMLLLMMLKYKNKLTSLW